MTLKAGKTIFLVAAVFSLLLNPAGPLLAGTETMYDYTKIPPFIEVGVDPNLLLLIDNSASMYDQAYRNPLGDNYCYVRGDEDLNGDGAFDSASEDNNGNGLYDKNYDPTAAYAGYFDPAGTKWYVAYHPTMTGPGFSDWYPSNPTGAAFWCANKVGTHYSNSDMCLTVDETITPNQVRAFAAKGRFLNWLMSSKFDVEKKVLTGGKYDQAHYYLTLENRGCDGKSFIKDVPVTSGGSHYVASFGVRGPTDAEAAVDVLYNQSTHNTRLDIFKVLPTGMNFSGCSEAIEAWNAGNLGQVKATTEDCLDPMGTGLFASGTAFNHIMQECWYYHKHGNWQPGNGTVNSLRNDCENVYNVSPGTVLPAAGYVAPNSLNGSDVCFGQYTPPGPHATSPWGDGYIGQCWEPIDTASGGTVTYNPVPCNPPPYTPPDGSKRCNAGYVEYCTNWNDKKQQCTGNKWAQLLEPVVSGGGITTSVGWTDDNSDGGDACIDYALKKYCSQIDEPTTIDPSDYTDTQGTFWGLPALLADAAAQSQLGKPLVSLVGRVWYDEDPMGLVQEFKYNLRMGAMQFNPGTISECAPVLRADGTYRASLYDCLQDKGADITAASNPDPDQINGGRIISYIDHGGTHITDLVGAINDITATAWTPLAEAYFEAIGYYTQKNSFRLNPDDYTCDEDYATDPASYPAWAADTVYAAGAVVSYQWDYDDNGLVDETKLYQTTNGGTSDADADTIGEDRGVNWTPFDPVLAGCQRNNILIITDGGSTADLNSTMTGFVTSGNHDGDGAVTYAAGNLEPPGGVEFTCKSSTGEDTLFGSSLMDDLSFYAHDDSFADIFATPTVNNVAKKKITTYVVSAGTLRDDGTGYDCNPKTQLTQVAANSGTVLAESTDLSQLEANLRNVFETIGGEPSSGSAASVISNSRSGEGAIFQAVFFPTQEDQLGNEITWAGDVHALWLDERGNIREDCGAVSCGAGDQDAKLDKTLDHILQFYTDPISSAARARIFSDDNGDGHYDPATDQIEDNISLRDIRYVWSAGEWLAKVAENVVETQRSYGGTGKQRYIVTSLNGASMIAFTPAAVSAGLGSANAYKGYFHAATVDEANDIISYIRGDDTRFFPDGVTPRGYRSRRIDWDENGTTEIWKLGDVVNSTPTVVSTPAEDYDLIYGDHSYQAFRKRYRNRRAMVYAGANDGGFHAFNGGYYNRATDTIDKAPPPDTDGATKVAYDLGAEMWMFVPKNLFPHLKWLTDPNYSHVNYVDFKPYIFDAKIFTPDGDHPYGWGTILVGGLGFGGGDIGVDTDGDGVDDLTLRSQYFILDITNPEVAPKILGEFTHPNLGFTLGAPTAVPILLCELKVDCPANGTNWPMDWYLAFPSGPYHTNLQAALNGNSDQFAHLFTVPLGGTGGLALANVTAPVGSTYTSFTVDDTTNFPNSFFSDVIAVDYDLNFKTDTLYFGSVAKASGDDPSQHTGGMHRLVIGEAADTLANPWGLHTFFKTPDNQPVSGAPSVSYDGQRAWIFFGTGRYYSAQLDKANHAQQSYYGLKEQYDDAGVMQLTQLSGANLIDVSDVWVAAGGDLHLTTGALPLQAYNYSNLADVTSADLPADVTTFAKLDAEMSVKDNLDLDKYNGWKLDFDQLGERNLGQAAILGNIVTFTTFVPSEDFCQPEGESFLWAPYYRTGTAYMRNVIGTVARDGETEVLRKLSVGVGLASTPNIHTGAEAGSTAFVQTSTGAIISVQQDNPGVVKGGAISWRELGD